MDLHFLTDKQAEFKMNRLNIGLSRDSVHIGEETEDR
jgi:hypothetical protein